MRIQTANNNLQRIFERTIRCSILKGGFCLRPSIKVVDVVVTDRGTIREILLPFHAECFEKQSLCSRS